MDAATERLKIRQIETLQKELRIWRWGVMFLTVLAVVYCIWTLSQSIRGLAEKGPDQEQFLTSVRTGLEHDVEPEIRTVASETITEVQPEIKDSINKLGKRVPELTQMAEDQLNQLQTNLPSRGQKVFEKEMNDMLTQRQDKIKEAYGQATDQQIRSLILSLETIGQDSIQEANQELFAPHQQKLNDILNQLQIIKGQEAKNVKGDQPSWEMAVLLLDLFRNDIKTIAGATSTSKAKVAPKVTGSTAVKGA